ncbi:MAG TPA: hypothetical protein VMF06_20300 [Candidatus Limnocylindria bacterium]|nr:hypothetical protein [Candidatus Limnocylindria bacterium]
MKQPLTCLLFLVLAGGCVSSTTTTTTPNRVTVVRARALTPLETDAAFAKLAQEIGPSEAFHRYTDAQSIELPPEGAPVIGRLAISESVKGLKPGSLQWTPQGGETSKGGDLAWTWGTYVLHTPEGDRQGKYVSVWHAGPDGSWFLSADIGNAK